MIRAGFGRPSDPPAALLVAGVRVVDPSTATDAVADLGVADGHIVQASDVPADAPRIDGRGLVAAPGFCDLGPHLGDADDPAAETIESGARAAAHGGYTTVAAAAAVAPDLACRVLSIGPAAGDGVVALTATGVATDVLARQACEADLPLIVRPDDAGGVVRAGPTAVRLGLPGWPPEIELENVGQLIALARRTGARIHVAHVSTAAAAEAVRTARAEGVRVTADVTPHHLALPDTWVAGDRRFAWQEPGPADPALAYDGSSRVSPPLATREDAAALAAAVEDGTVDAIATDHAPRPPERTIVPFDQAAGGIAGLETALSIGLAAVQAGVLSLTTLVRALSTGPAGIIGQWRGLAIGSVADLVVFDPNARWRVTPTALASRARNTPLLGMELPGVVRLTIADGRVTYRA
ncbi:MAG TPA: amidohydrolase family protein [Candidatus Limnocylindria bacterium]|nr:amidohydrolase family protein [Candidatus Limnocylindria bacterium]